MTAEFGAPTQLEKIDMLDFADAVAINKFDRRGAADALRDVRKQVQRNRNAFGCRLEEMPVYGTIASRFSDDGVTALYHHLREKLAAKGLVLGESRLPKPPTRSRAVRINSFQHRVNGISLRSHKRSAPTNGTHATRHNLLANSNTCANQFAS